MNKNGLMLTVIDDIDNYSNQYPHFKKEVITLLNKFPKFINHVLTIKEDLLYNSNIHGITHSEKVLLFATLLGIDENLDDRDMQIIIDAAKYHDIGRSCDSEDSLHGYHSSLKIEDALSNNIYDDSNNLNMLKAIIEIHSLDDSNDQKVFKKYHLDDFDHFKKMYSILKDADALDRNRFSNDYNSDLDISYLRLPNSLKLVNCSEEINNIYASNNYKKRLS